MKEVVRVLPPHELFKPPRGRVWRLFVKPLAPTAPATGSSTTSSATVASATPSASAATVSLVLASTVVSHTIIVAAIVFGISSGLTATFLDLICEAIATVLIYVIVPRAVINKVLFVCQTTFLGILVRFSRLDVHLHVHVTRRGLGRYFCWLCWLCWLFRGYAGLLALDHDGRGPSVLDVDI